LALFHTLESRGIRVSELNDGKADRIATALEIVDRTDPVILYYLRWLDPDTFRRALENAAVAQ
jgi:hypothetical protein